MKAFLYTDIYTDRAILAVENEGTTCGITFDPLSTATPIPWSSNCPHCRAGRLGGVPTPIRREIRMLASRRADGSHLEYEIPTIGRPHLVHARTTPGGVQHLEVRLKLRTGGPMPKKYRRATISWPGKLELDGDPRRWRSPILRRCLRLLASARPATREEFTAALSPLVELEKKQRKIPRGRGGRRLPCRELAWSAIVEKNQ